MAASLCYPAPLPINTSSKQPALQSPAPPPCLPRKLPLPSLKFTARPTVASAATTVGVEPQSGAATPPQASSFPRDVLLHCVVDAILGALGLPDIGQIFPDTDPKWKGAASCVFVEEAVRLMHEAGYELGNLDATLILQRPKLSPHKEAIRENLCKLLGADPSAVNLKAKTHEKVDSLGENRSIAAHTVVLLFRK
ncbi:hypothetical protein SASPL_131083 [Salvia splendens]|uniref:2-C-methyl-D-erythritol 2,4-cyclodiphosphate synthase n=1 Tax=Salvia splendens TaxID=180675 RepID=A0A8X8X9E9_SALSN|nr:hypothetical protein SASPL_131083 [Salvia splendens]